MGAQLGSGKGKVVPIINVTPLVDVVLVLLIIFMVIIPNVQDGKSIEMVKVAKADKPDGKVEPVTITIDFGEVITVGDEETNQAAMIEKLTEVYNENTRTPVLIRGDARLPYSVVRDVFQSVQNVGFAYVSLAVGVQSEWKEEE